MTQMVARTTLKMYKERRVSSPSSRNSPIEEIGKDNYQLIINNQCSNQCSILILSSFAYKDQGNFKGHVMYRERW